MSIRILFIEDDDLVRPLLMATAHEAGFIPSCVDSAENGLEILSKDNFDVVVTDISLPGMSGLDLLRELQGKAPETPTIVITGFATIDKAVEAMKRGATDFITKPFETEHFIAAVKVATEKKRPAKSVQSSDGEGAGRPSILAASPVMLDLLRQIEAIAPFDMSVLITGETGTGKELIARAIHGLSRRRNATLVSLNCAAVPEQLLEDELFGHVKGAFTGAHVAREGRFERAQGGTLFLDEIGDMSITLQPKLLRVLQEKEFEKLGSSKSTKTDVRVIAATSTDLKQSISDGNFRSDLYYRLNVVNLRVPPLRERPEDIPLLANALLGRFCEAAGLPSKEIGHDVWPVLEAYGWPGNVRQLQNAMERAAALSGLNRVIEVKDLPDEVRSAEPRHSRATIDLMIGEEVKIPSGGLDYESMFNEYERKWLLVALNEARGNKMQAARLLNMKRTTFVEKLKRLGIDRDSS
jgi:DNA-binding NtrC family response regulator